MTQPGEEILDEHHQCMKLVAEVDSWMREQDSPQWAATLHERLGVLGAALEKHFHAEEVGYLFVGLLEAHPRFAGALERLRGEHAPLLRSLAEVSEIARRMRDGDPEIDGTILRKRLRAVLATLRRHESEENEILYCASWDDLGTGE